MEGQTHPETGFRGAPHTGAQVYRIRKIAPIDPTAFMRWAVDLALLARSFGGEIAGGDGFGEPVLTPDLVEFNGSGKLFEDHAPFRFALEAPLGETHVSTGFFRPKPYDTVVQAALILMREHFPESVEVDTSLGDPDWQGGKDLVRVVLDRDIQVFAH